MNSRLSHSWQENLPLKYERLRAKGDLYQMLFAHKKFEVNDLYHIVSKRRKNCTFAQTAHASLSFLGSFQEVEISQLPDQSERQTYQGDRRSLTPSNRKNAAQIDLSGRTWVVRD